MSQKEPRIEQFVRQENQQWLLRESSGLEGTLASPSLETTIALAEVYAGVVASVEHSRRSCLFKRASCILRLTHL